jgi:hypothetical protein
VSLAFGIFCLLGVMNWAINLDYQITCRTIEIDHKTINRMLAPEFAPGKLTVANMFPERSFRRGRITPHFPRGLDKLLPQLRGWWSWYTWHRSFAYLDPLPQSRKGDFSATLFPPLLLGGRGGRG